MLIQYVRAWFKNKTIFPSQELQKAITCLAGFAHFYQEGFSQAKDLFM